MGQKQILGGAQQSRPLPIDFPSILFTESINTWARPMRDALLDRENCNVILVDWSKGAKFPYGRAAGNARLVGAQIAELIRFLISSNNGFPHLANRFCIVGFSLGAQTAGYAGSNLRAHGMVLGRITGTALFKQIYTSLQKKTSCQQQQEKQNNNCSLSVKLQK